MNKAYLPRPDSVKQTVDLLLALGFRPIPFTRTTHTVRGVEYLWTEEFTKYEPANTQRVIMDYRSVWSYTCTRCPYESKVLVADLVTHNQYHDDRDAGRPSRFSMPDPWRNY